MEIAEPFLSLVIPQCSCHPRAPQTAHENGGSINGELDANDLVKGRGANLGVTLPIGLIELNPLSYRHRN
jgi:hypothetical protein